MHLQRKEKPNQFIHSTTKDKKGNEEEELTAEQRRTPPSIFLFTPHLGEEDGTLTSRRFYRVKNPLKFTEKNKIKKSIKNLPLSLKK